MSFQPKITAIQETVLIRSLHYRVYRWGDPDAEPLFLLHGWADTGMSFQFLADALGQDWNLIAPDWRGFGDTDKNPGGYWFPDYLADLQALIDIYKPQGTVRLLGHSMGGNIVCFYAGIRPDQVSHVISLEAFGLADTTPDKAPARYARWLQQWQEQTSFVEYEGLQAIVKGIQKLAPHISIERASFIAAHRSSETEQGKRIYKFDPAHKRVNPILFRREEARSCWRRITANVLFVLGAESQFHQYYFEEGGREEAHACFSHLTESIIQGSGHMLHLEQPERLAHVLDEFLS